MNYYEHRLQEIKEALILFEGREDTKDLVEQLKEERYKIYKIIATIDILTLSI